MKFPAWVPFASLTAVASLGLAIFFTLYSLIPVTRADTPGLSSLFLGTLMAFVMGVQALTPSLVSRFSLRLVLAGSVMLTAIGGLLTGVSESTPALLAGAVAAGVGFGVLIVAGSQGIALLVSEARLGRMIGIYGLVTMAAAAIGSPLGVQIAITFSPSVLGVCTLVVGVIAFGLSFGVPGVVGRKQLDQGSPVKEKHLAVGQSKTRRMLELVAGAPWLVLGFLLIGVVLLSHGLSSLPVLASTYGSAAVVIFFVQAGNALGRWLGGEVEARSSTGATVVTGAILLAAGGVSGVLAASTWVMLISGVLIGTGIGVVQTVTLHTAMRLLSAGRASVMWNLSVDAGLWVGGILWGLALTTGFVRGGVWLFSALILVVGVLLVQQLRRKLDREAEAGQHAA